jgi:small subunit ribosomal protein S2
MTGKYQAQNFRGRWGIFMASVVPPLVVFLLAAIVRRRRMLHRNRLAARFSRPALQEITLSEQPETAESGPSTQPEVELSSAPAERAEETGPTDDLTLVEGIGPKVAELLAQNGIRSFRKLAMADPAELRRILDEARLRFINPESWPEQAVLAADGKMEELEELQKNLRGGRRNVA